MVWDAPQPPPGVWQPLCALRALAGAMELVRAGMSSGVGGSSHHILPTALQSVSSLHCVWGSRGEPPLFHAAPSFVKMSLLAQDWWRKCGVLLCSSCHDLKPY